jgi:glycosyltransferase involved in cell wall biosynthesis
MARDQTLRIGLIAAPWLPVPPPRYGGSELVIDTLARFVTAAGHEVVLFTTGDSTSPVERRWLYDRADPAHMGTTVRELRHVAAAYDNLTDVDLIHDHTVAGLLYRHRPAVPVVTTQHGPFDDDLNDLYRRATRELSLIAISPDQARRAPTGIPIAAVIPHGIDLDRYPLDPLGGDDLVFLGRMDPSKGVHIAARVAKRVGRRLTIAARLDNADEHRYFTEQVEPLLDPDVVFVGELDHTAKLELLQSAKALLNPIQWPEPFGLVMVEALACGTPVIACPIGAASEIIDHGTTGFLARDDDELVRAVDHIDQIDRQACRLAVKERFSAERMAADHIALYRRLTTSGQRVPADPYPRVS